MARRDPCDKVMALVELAAGKTTPPHEAAAAALAACRKIKGEKLLVLRFIEDESPGTGRSYDSPSEVVNLQVHFVILNQSNDMYRVAQVEPPKRHSSTILLIPKMYVEDVVMMTPEEAKNIGWRGSSIIKSMRISKTYFEQATRNGWNKYQ